MSDESPPPEKTPQVSPTHSDEKQRKIDLLLKPAGDAPIMKKKKWAVDVNKKVGWVNCFIRKYLKVQPGESLFLYVDQSFSPQPDQTMEDLYDCFGSDGRIVLHYCTTQAWG